MVREGGLEPPPTLRGLEPESSESANSTTRAYIELSCGVTLTVVRNHSFEPILQVFAHADNRDKYSITPYACQS